MRHAAWWTIRQRVAPYAFLSPFLLLLAVFFLYPLARSLVLSMHQTIGATESRFVGLGNFIFLLRDRLFWFAVLKTAGFTLAFLLIQVPASLGLALLMNHPRLRGRNVLRFAFFSPYLVGPVFVAVLFGQIFAPRHGLLMRGLAWLGVPSDFSLLGDPQWVMVGVLVAALWLSIGFGMIYLLAALQAVDRSLHEAAAIDGAGAWGQFWHVTLPSIRPVLSFLVLVGTVASLQLFELPYVLLDGPGPGGAGMTIVMYLFIVGWGAGDLGYASAIGWALVMLIAVVGLVQLRIGRALK